MNYENEFLSIFKGRELEICKESLDLPLIFSNISIFNISNFLYIVPDDSANDLNDAIKVKNLLEKEKPNSRVYIFVPKFFRDYISAFSKSRINFINSYGEEHYFNGTSKSFTFFESIDNVKYNKSTQLVFKYFILKNTSTSTVREIQNVVHLSTSTISIALYTLYKMRILDLEGNSTSSSYHLRNRKEAFQILSKHFINPIKNRSYVMINQTDVENLTSNYLLSGERAIEQYTNLSAKHETLQIAILEKQAKNLLSKLHSETTNYPILLEMQSFIYDPTLFSIGNVVDEFDTYLILKFDSSLDVREEYELKALEEKLIYGEK